MVTKLLSSALHRGLALASVVDSLAGKVSHDGALLRTLQLQRPGGAERRRPPQAPSGPQLGERAAPGQGDGINPFVVVGAAFATGIVLAKLVSRSSRGPARR